MGKGNEGGATRGPSTRGRGGGRGRGRGRAPRSGSERSDTYVRSHESLLILFFLTLSNALNASRRAALTAKPSPSLSNWRCGTLDNVTLNAVLGASSLV